MKLYKSIPCLVTVLMISPLILGGCNCAGDILHPDHCADIPHGAMPDPPGQHVQRFQALQAKNADAVQFAIYLNDWFMGEKKLGPYGEYHLQLMIKRLPKVPYCIMIQPDMDPDLNEYRRSLIITRLMQAGIANPESRVRLEYPEAEGLFGEEAPRIFRTMLIPRTTNQFGQGAFGQGGLGGFGTGGFGGFGGFPGSYGVVGGFGGGFPGYTGGFPGGVP